MLPPEERLPGMQALVEERLYFVLHAPRQTGKTTAMRAFATRLCGLGYVALWATLETSQGVEDTGKAEPLWLRAVAESGRELPESLRPPDPRDFRDLEVGSRFQQYLRTWCEQVGKPVVLLLDEADVVSGPALVSLLRQLRAGFNERGNGSFPVSIALIGMRDLRDYLTAAKDGTSVNPGSPFNLKKVSLTLRSFSLEEVRSLYQQHSNDTGQIFTSEAVDRAFAYTQGQPFLVNALAYTAVRELAADKEPITAEHIEAAKERLILSRTTHLDALAQRLKEPRVARIIAAVMAGKPSFEIDRTSDDLLYCEDLGLLRTKPRIEVANPLYREVLVRVLTGMTEPDLPEKAWIKNGKLDVPLLIDGFLRFWRQHAEALTNRDNHGYHEVVPHLLFMAWLQKVVNGGGRITREYALGRGRLDVYVEFGGERHAFEIKRVTPHDSLTTVREDGLEQLAGYLERLGISEGWLLIFDQRPGHNWEQKLWSEEVEVEGRKLHLRGA
jgi:hypothetical protein